MSSTSTLSLAQQQILTLISAGSTVAASARQAGIHRNTIYNWLRLSGFRDALEQARYENALQWHEQCATLAPAAINTLAEILKNPDGPASVRARIALAIVNRAATPPPPPPLVDSLDDTQESRMPEEPEMPEVPEAPIETKPQIVPKSAQSPVLNSVKTGRNEPCPCGSGIKFKRCCLDKMRSPAGYPPNAGS